MKRADNIDSYVKVKQVNRKIQNFFDSGFYESVPPDPPEVIVAESDRSVKLNWSNSEGSNNPLNAYHERAPLGDPDYPFYDLEGYELWQFASANVEWPSCLDRDLCQMIDVFDKPNFVRRVIHDPDGMVLRHCMRKGMIVSS